MLKSVEVNNSHVVVVDLLTAPHCIRVIHTFKHYRCGYIHNEKKNCLHFIAIFVITSTSQFLWRQPGRTPRHTTRTQTVLLNHAQSRIPYHRWPLSSSCMRTIGSVNVQLLHSIQFVLHSIVMMTFVPSYNRA